MIFYFFMMRLFEEKRNVVSRIFLSAFIIFSITFIPAIKEEIGGIPYLGNYTEYGEIGFLIGNAGKDDIIFAPTPYVAGLLAFLPMKTAVTDPFHSNMFADSMNRSVDVNLRFYVNVKERNLGQSLSMLEKYNATYIFLPKQREDGKLLCTTPGEGWKYSTVLMQVNGDYMIMETGDWSNFANTLNNACWFSNIVEQDLEGIAEKVFETDKMIVLERIV